MNEKVGQSLLTWVGKHALEDILELTTTSHNLHGWFSWLSWPRQ